MWRRSSLLKTRLMQLRKKSLTKTKIQACRDSNPDLCDTGAVLWPIRIILLLNDIQYLTYNLYTYFTSAHLQCTYSEHFQWNTGCVCKKICISKRAVNFAKFFSYGNSLMLTIVLVLKQKLGGAQHSITYKFNNTHTNKSKNSGPH